MKYKIVNQPFIFMATSKKTKYRNLAIFTLFFLLLLVIPIETLQNHFDFNFWNFYWVPQDISHEWIVSGQWSRIAYSGLCSDNGGSIYQYIIAWLISSLTNLYFKDYNEWDKPSHDVLVRCFYYHCKDLSKLSSFTANRIALFHRTLDPHPYLKWP
jgi:hypothetical protein